MAKIKCEKCGQMVDVSEKEAEWKTMCKRCYARMKQAENERKSKYGSNQQPVKFQKASQQAQPSIDADVTMLLNIAKNIAFNLEKEIKDLNDGEQAWVSTIFIQRKRSV